MLQLLLHAGLQVSDMHGISRSHQPALQLLYCMHPIVQVENESWSTNSQSVHCSLLYNLFYHETLHNIFLFSSMMLLCQVINKRGQCIIEVVSHCGL